MLGGLEYRKRVQENFEKLFHMLDFADTKTHVILIMPEQLFFSVISYCNTRTNLCKDVKNSGESFLLIAYK